MACSRDTNGDHAVTTLTPTQDLLIEVLVARARLGERLWTFDSRHTKALNALADQGWVWLAGGVVERTVRASLTDLGKQAFMSNIYTPPIVKDARKGRREHEPNCGIYYPEARCDCR